MKISQITLSSLILFLSACSQFSSGENIITPTVMSSLISATPDITLTLQPTKTIIPAALSAQAPDETCESPAYTWYSEISPDNNWTAVVCREERDDVGSYLHVFNTHNKLDWRIYFRDYANGIPTDRNDMFYPFHWSINGQSLYVVHPTRLSGTIGLGPGGDTLVQIELSTGKANEVVSGIGEVPQISFSFSQDDKFLLYIPQSFSSYEVNILDLATQKTRVIELHGNNLYGVGFAIWSNDNKKIALLFKDEKGISSVVLLDLTNSSQKTLVKDMEFQLYPIRWEDENMVLLSSNYPFHIGNEQWLLDIRNGEMTKLSK